MHLVILILRITKVTQEKYDFKINVIKSGILFQEKIYNVEMKQDTLQIVNVSFKNKTEKQVEALVEYAPCEFNFQDVKSLSLFKEKIVDGAVKQDGETQTEYKKIESDFQNNNKFDIEFNEFGNYELKFVYKFKETSSAQQPSVQASNSLSVSESENQNFDLNSLTREQSQNSDSPTISGADDENSETNGGVQENDGVSTGQGGSSDGTQGTTESQTKPPVEKVENHQ